MSAVTHPLQGAKSKSAQCLEELNNNLGFIVNLSEIKPAWMLSWPRCCTAWGEEAGWRGSILALMEVLMDDRRSRCVRECVRVRVKEVELNHPGVR